MQALLKGEIDAAQAMIYNEYAQVLEAKNPATGKLYTPDDFNVINWNDVGTAMLQDAIWANTDKLDSDPAYQDTADEVRQGVASRAGCTAATTRRSAATSCVAKGSKLGASHQLWQMNEINKLIWPSADGVGIIDEQGLGPDRRRGPEHQERRGHDGDHQAARRGGLHQRRSPTAARAQLKDEDTTGSSFKPLDGDPQRGRLLTGTVHTQTSAAAPLRSR